MNKLVNILVILKLHHNIKSTTCQNLWKSVFFFLYKENSCIYGPQKLHDIIIIMKKLMKSRPYVCVCVCVSVQVNDFLLSYFSILNSE